MKPVDLAPDDLAIVGATGAVGEAVVELLQQRKLPVSSVHFLASERTAGTSLMYAGSPVMVTELKDFDFSRVGLAIFVANDEVSRQYVPLAQAEGCATVDNSQAFVDSVPLVVPCVNGDILVAKPDLVVNPDGNAIVLSTILRLFIDNIDVDKVSVATYQSVSGHGKKAIHELASQTASLLNGRGAEADVFSQQIAFNVLPYIDEIDASGYSSAEKHLVAQTRRLLGDASLCISASCA